jgi:pyruvate,water dikinase
MDMLYLALFPNKGDNFLSNDFFDLNPNRLVEYIPEAEQWTDVIKVIRADDVAEAAEGISLAADAFKQKVVCYRVE